MRRKKTSIFLLIIPIILVLGLVYLLPPVREWVDWHVDQLRTKIAYTLFPPEQSVFVPQEQKTAAAKATELALTPTVIPSATQTKTPTSTAVKIVLEPTITLMPTATLLPASIALKGVKFTDQHGLYNYCAPANLAMILSFWGWKGNREDAGKLLKPFEKDYNVMPYEMATYVNDNTDYSAIVRSGGTLEILKNLTAAGFPVLVEKGAYMRDLAGKVSWMGHYQVVTGYDEEKQEFIAKDSYYGTLNKPDVRAKYDVMVQEWRAFNFVFLVVASKDHQTELSSLLGKYADETTADQIAAQTAAQEAYTLTGQDQFFAWFNRGTSLERLQDFFGASQAYDQAFQIYEKLPEDKRPYRIMWYQTGPYFAYFYSGRYQDVVNLATQTLSPLEAAGKPYLEESYYWRAKAKIVIGDRTGAIADYQSSLIYHPGFQPSLEELAKLGINQ